MTIKSNLIIIYNKKNNIQALSRDFQHVCGKMHAQIQLGMRWCAKCIFPSQRFCNFIKGIVHIYIHRIFTKVKTIVFIVRTY